MTQPPSRGYLSLILPPEADFNAGNRKNLQIEFRPLTTHHSPGRAASGEWCVGGMPTRHFFLKQHCLYFLPLPHGQAAFRPIRSPVRVTVAETVTSGSDSRRLRAISFFSLMNFPRIRCPLRGLANDSRET